MYTFTHWVVDVEHVIVRVPRHISSSSLSVLVHHDGSILVEEAKEGGASGTTLKPYKKRGRRVAILQIKGKSNSNATLNTYILFRSSFLLIHYTCALKNQKYMLLL